MGQVFLSYAREDRGVAQKLARVIEGAGHDVWWDRHIGGGEEFSDQIEEALDRADVVVVAWSRESIRSRWVRDEAAAGGDSGRLVPVSIDGSAPPMGFRQFHTMDLAGWKGSKRDERTRELLQSIERLLNGKAIATTSALAEPKPMPKDTLSFPRLTGLLIATVIGLGALFLIFDHPFGRGGRPPTPSIAIGAFTTTSSDPSARDVAGLSRDSVAQALSRSGLPIKLIDGNGGDAAKPTADYILSGEFSAEPDKILATLRLDDAAQHATVWTHQFEENRKNATVLPDRIGAQVAGSLNWAGKIEFLRPADVDFTAKLLQIDIIRNPLENYQNAARLASQHPDSAAAQLSLAMYTSFALWDLPQDQRASALMTARRAAQIAKSLVPHFGDVYIPDCVLYPGPSLAECEDALRAGLKADPDAPFVNSFLSDVLSEVGRNEEAVNRANLSYQHDPYMPAKIARIVQMLELSGDTREADSIYANGVRWWPQWNFFRPRISGILQRGDFDALRHVEQEPGANRYDGSHGDSLALVAAVDARSIPRLTKACTGAHGLYSAMCMLAFAKIGGLDEAYALADEFYPRQVGRNAKETEDLWLQNGEDVALDLITSSAAAPMRRDPRYVPLAERTGLLAYWRSGRAPDFCQRNAEPVCRTILKRS